MDAAKKERKEAKRKFTRLQNIILDTLNSGARCDVIDRRFKELTVKWNEVEKVDDKVITLLDNDQEKVDDKVITLLGNDQEKVHDKVITLLDNDQEEAEEDKWITELSKIFYDLEMEVGEYLNNDEKVDANIVKTRNSEKQKSSIIKVERMKFQTFNGDIRRFPKFKEEFVKHIQPLCDEEQLAFVLK